MPLRKKTRFTVTPLVSLFDWDGPGVPFVPQFLTQWCWAACGEMVLKGDGHDFRQCDVANFVLNKSSCCDLLGTGCSAGSGVNGPANPACNDLANENQVDDLWTHFLNRQVTHSQTPIEKADLIQRVHIDKRPVQIWWELQGASVAKHVVLVVGHKIAQHDDQFLVHDPCHGPSTHTYEELLQSEGQWLWTLTWDDL